jgi:hypothetical protein
MSEYKGYGSEVIMDKVAELPTLEAQVALLKAAICDQVLAAKLADNPRFVQWLHDNKEKIIEFYTL